MSPINGAKESPMVYKQLSEEMRAGLKNIYQQISSASGSDRDPEHKASALITEASSQLDEVIKTTETATMKIMTIVEKQFGLAEKSATLLSQLRSSLSDDDDLKELIRINQELTQDLTEVLTSLSFQDITGQRIKKAMTALKGIEQSVLDLYLSSGLVMKAADEDPGGDADKLQAEAQKAVEEYRDIAARSELKGPDKNALSQETIDAMLSQLGL